MIHDFSLNYFTTKRRNSYSETLIVVNTIQLQTCCRKSLDDKDSLSVNFGGLEKGRLGRVKRS